jgi:hypothetical protein
MIREIIKVILQPLKAVWSIFDNDAHKIISKRGIEVLDEQKNKIDSIHDVSNFKSCSNEEIKGLPKCEKQCQLCYEYQRLWLLTLA